MNAAIRATALVARGVHAAHATAYRTQPPRTGDTLRLAAKAHRSVLCLIREREVPLAEAHAELGDAKPSRPTRRERQTTREAKRVSRSAVVQPIPRRHSDAHTEPVPWPWFWKIPSSRGIGGVMTGRDVALQPRDRSGAWPRQPFGLQTCHAMTAAPCGSAASPRGSGEDAKAGAFLPRAGRLGQKRPDALTNRSRHLLDGTLPQ